MKNGSKIAIAVAAVGAWLLAKKSGKISGVGAVDNEWGANEMYLWVMNTESLYNRYRNAVKRWIDLFNGDRKTIEAKIVFYLKNDIARGAISFNPGMGRGDAARKIAAKDIYDAFYEDWEYDQKHKS